MLHLATITCTALYLANKKLCILLQKAEALVRKWDCLLQREKQDRHARLLERLDLQHRLIAKTDLAFRQSLRDAKQKRAQV